MKNKLMAFLSDCSRMDDINGEPTWVKRRAKELMSSLSPSSEVEKPMTAKEILGKHSKNYGSDIGNPKAIVRASEALAAMEEHASQKIKEQFGDNIHSFNSIKDLHPYMLRHPDKEMVRAACLHYLGDDAQIASQKPQGGEMKLECPQCGDTGKKELHCRCCGNNYPSFSSRDKWEEPEDRFSKFAGTSLFPDKGGEMTGDYVNYLERMIETCLNDKDLQREHWAFCQALKKYREIASPSLPTDEEIKKECDKRFLGNVAPEYFTMGAMWMREQMKLNPALQEEEKEDTSDTNKWYPNGGFNNP